jgi:hypothetical protein
MPILFTEPHSGSYLHWGVINISLTNLTIIVVMVVMVAIFVAALLLPFPHGDESPRADGHPRGDRP